MKEESIHFFTEDTPYQLRQRTEIRAWLKTIAKKEKYSIVELNYIFCSDKKILEINKTFLNHNYYTDIISFDYTNSDKSISGDIFISIDMVLHNSKKFNSSFNNELMRVMIHGVLHFLGLKDK